jgi:hypothetical protein
MVGVRPDNFAAHDVLKQLIARLLERRGFSGGSSGFAGLLMAHRNGYESEALEQKDKRSVSRILWAHVRVFVTTGLQTWFNPAS